jgi:16S rRNA (cytidine1402-2'-O)-methyltransferase
VYLIRVAGTLYVVATPIGNLEDISPRALRVLREVRLIVAEDTRTTKKLLSYYKIHTPMMSYHQHSPKTRETKVLQILTTNDVALVSEAGTPTLSDPGGHLVVQAAKKNIPVVPIPGPSAITAALSVSGFSTNSFLFLGFLPARKGKRRKRIEKVVNLPYTLVLFESPHRLVKTLQDLAEILGNRRLIIARELTKLHEEVWSGTLDRAVSRYLKIEPRGEFTLVVEPLNEIR